MPEQLSSWGTSGSPGWCTWRRAGRCSTGSRRTTTPRAGTSRPLDSESCPPLTGALTTSTSMCEPTTIMAIAAGISAVSAGVAYQEGKSAAKTQEKAMEANATLEQNALSRQAQQTAEAAAEHQNERALAARQEMAAFDAVTGEFGGGVSAQRMASEVAFNRQKDLASISRNRDNSVAEIGYDRQAA